jgi:alpha-L-fucosidase
MPHQRLISFETAPVETATETDRSLWGPSRDRPEVIYMNRRDCISAALSMLLTVTQAAIAQDVDDSSPVNIETRQADYSPSRSNLEARKWFQDAKFGIFLHWGLYSELGGAGKSGLAEWIMNDAQIPVRKYERLAQFFNPSRFDADAWVSSFKAAGARYIVITSKHHDGFAMFHSQVSRYNIVDATPFKRDPIKELATACQQQGIKLFLYYSQLDWHSTDYFPRGATGQFAGRPNSGDWNRYLEYQDAQLRELLTNYGPIGGIWLDGWWDQQGTTQQGRWQLDRTYRVIHNLQPSTLIVNNHHQKPFPGEDYQTFERDLPDDSSTGFEQASVGSLPLEMSETMNGSWGFNLTDDIYKSSETLVRTMVGAAGRGANFLLNTGPMPNGEIQPENLKTLSEIGAWLKIYGRSIYGSRAGPVSPRPWGVTTRVDGVIYIHILDWRDDRLFVPISTPVKRASLLGDGHAVAIKSVPGGIEIALAPRQAGEWDRVIALEL